MTRPDTIPASHSASERSLGLDVEPVTLSEVEPNLAGLDFAASLAQGLAQRPRRIASKWLYDETGAALFEDIVAAPDYYISRAERAILKVRAPEIAEAFGEGGSLVELGSGASTKVRLLLDAMPELARYVPVEISEAQLAEAAEAIQVDYPELDVVPMAADFTQPFDLPAEVRTGRAMGFFTGTTLCNLLPPNSEAFLRRMHGILGPDSLFVVGVDLQKDEDTLLQAYNDPGGAIWNFNLNIIDRINRELGTGIDRSAFRHEATYNDIEGRIEAAIYPLRDVVLSVSGETFQLPAEEPIILEYSHKYTLQAFAALAARAGWDTLEAWTDDEQLFSVHLLTNRSAA